MFIKWLRNARRNDKDTCSLFLHRHWCGCGFWQWHWRGAWESPVSRLSSVFKSAAVAKRHWMCVAVVWIGCIVRHTRRDLQQVHWLVSCCGLWNLFTRYLAAKKFNRLNAIYLEEKMQLEEQLGKVDSIPCKTTGIREIYSLTSHSCPLHPLLTFHIRAAHRAKPLGIYVIYPGNKLIYFICCKSLVIFHKILIS